MDFNTPAGIGHNEPPSDLETAAKTEIDAAIAKLKPRLDELESSVGRARAVDEESAGKVTDLIGMFQTLEGRIARAHAEVKEPYLNAGRVVDGRARAMAETIATSRKALVDMLTAYQMAQADRVRELREAERAAEAADPEPTATSHRAVDEKRATVRGDFGASAKLQDVLVIEKVDVKKLPKAFLQRAKILTIIEAEAKVVIRAGGTVNGVTSSTGQTSRVRKGG